MIRNAPLPAGMQALLYLFVTLLGASCAARSAPLPAAGAEPEIITVSAAASLKDALTELSQTFEAAHAGVKIALNFGSSGALQMQIEQGAPADVFVSAATEQMDALAAKNLVLPETRVNLLRNELVLIVPRDSKSVANFVANFGDLAGAGVRVVAMGDPRSVPAGVYAQQTLTALGIYDAVKAKAVLATDVRQVLADVETGSADAGLVYATDARISQRVRVVADAPAGTHSPIVYPAAVLRGSPHAAVSRTFVEFLKTPAAGAVFEKYGFQPVDRSTRE